MCLTCGCGDEENVRVSTLDPNRLDTAHDHGSDHGHGHGHGHTHDDNGAHDHKDPASLSPAAAPQVANADTLVLGERILAKNDRLAEQNRRWLRQRDIPAVNLMSSPGAGKTSLLERTIAELHGSREICVIEGDQETLFDAERITAAGARAVQVNTGAGCHLDAPMVGEAIDALAPSDGSLLFIENVGNLVCPALFDVGEQVKVVVISVTEGDDKPLKYPHMFSAADLVVVNKTDLLPYVDFDLDKLHRQARSLQPDVEVIALSVRAGDNLEAWYAWLRAL
ncbi:MAG: hydrogenase nickel incorporation protein HypB [Nocardioidaceae bacterium]